MKPPHRALLRYFANARRQVISIDEIVSQREPPEMVEDLIRECIAEGYLIETNLPAVGITKAALRKVRNR